VTIGDYANYDNVTLGQTGPFGAGDSTAVGFDGATSDMTAPPTLDMADGRSALSVGLWFQTNTPGGVLFGYAHDPLSTAPPTGAYVPALYIGTDGNLYGQLWTGTAAPVHTTTAVTDNKWHYAVLSGSGSTQTLYLDGVPVGSLSGTINITSAGNDSVGAGYLGPGWPAQPNPSTA